ncbi:hypothetical protein ACFY00_33800 [Kitasatospora sp. NPDC001540]|uniref:hypothetical protein n=1 Tax=Kitasatospora sp. NPDC001540 TaxID=3364014 RepID=UPI0036954F1E
MPSGTEDGAVETVLLGLGAWLSNQKTRRAKLSVEQLHLLGRAGVEWAAELAPVRREKGKQLPFADELAR